MATQPFDWTQYFVLAYELGDRTTEVACLRSAISRAYYYIYHLALERAEALGFARLPGEGVHSQLWRLFNDNPEGACRVLGQIALRLKEKRERADYESVFTRIEEEVPAVLDDAREFARLLSILPPRHPNPRSVRQ